MSSIHPPRRRLIAGALTMAGALAALLPALPVAAQAPLRVVATTPSMGALVHAVAGDGVLQETLVAPGRDAHDLSARPSMIAHLRRADVVVSVGAQLEDGWLPAALDAAANPRLRPGQPGHFAVAGQLRLHDTRFDPALGGHVHAEGNPHFNLAPALMAQAAEALAIRLGALHPQRAEAFRLRARLFALKLRTRLPQWRARLAGPLQALAYHEEFDYFSAWLPVSLVGFIEPKPGVPPSARHLSELAARHAGSHGVVLYADYQPARAPQALAATLGWPAIALPLEPLHPTGEAYLALVEQWVTALAQTTP
ncbi:MAG: metal ABC transporter substrate-binding protein [Rhodocyclaceae bacterium]